jgi:anti-anti-sigma regulatory factor
MATRFQSIELNNPHLFGVQLAGTVGPGDKKPLIELADKCLDKEKIHLILDFSEVKTMGGGGASVLAGFQEKLVAVGGEAVFVGAGEIVRNFLEQKFESLPLRHFDVVADAEAALAEVAPLEPDPVDVEEVSDELDEVGAVGLFEEGAKDLKVDNLIEEFSEEQTKTGRRKDHRYTSLAEAVKALGSISDSEGEKEFSEALGNLLFSQGLAEEVTLMVAQNGVLGNHDGKSAFKCTGSLAEQFLQVDRPLTLLDIQDDELAEDEITLLADLNPDMILPVVKDGELTAVIMLKRGGDDREYTVAENFAFELLITVLAGAGDTSDGPDALELQAAAVNCHQNLAEEEEAFGLSMPKDQHVTEVLLKLVMDLPKADDEHHFWRIFSRHAWSVLHLGELAFLPPDRTRPQAILNQKNFRMGLDLGNERLQHFFRSIERPIEVRNFPSFFKDIKEKLIASGVTWVVGLNWDKEYLGAILMDGVADPGDGSVVNQLADLYTHTSRMFAQFGERKDSADDSLAIVRILTSQREMRVLGSDSMTSAIIEQVDLLAREMGFPPDQKRNLLYGCLLRDIGLIHQPDRLMSPESGLNPAQQAEYRKHPQLGADLLAGLKLPTTIVDVVRCHHEQFNGEGFPAGISGRKIPLAARVVTLVEGYVKLITGAEGRRALSAKDAGRVILQNKEGRYDPDLAVVLLSAVGNQSTDPAASPGAAQGALR